MLKVILGLLFLNFAWANTNAPDLKTLCQQNQNITSIRYFAITDFNYVKAPEPRAYWIFTLNFKAQNNQHVELLYTPSPNSTLDILDTGNVAVSNLAPRQKASEKLQAILRNKEFLQQAFQFGDK